MQVAGTKGAVMVGAVEAASLVSWSLVSAEDQPGSYTFTGQTGTVNTFRITQRPLGLRLQVGKNIWRWKQAELELVGDRVRAIVARPEVL